MFRKLTFTAAALLSLAAGQGMAAEGGAHLHDIGFSFEGPFGTYDQMQLQRGLQVYTEVCAACHGLKFVPFRALGEPGGPALPEDQVRAYAAQFDIYDAELDDTRPGIPTDYFPHSALENAPDLSLMAKARAGFHGPLGTGLSQLFNGIGGPEYIANLLSSFTGEEKEQAGTVFYENPIFSTGWIAMTPPLADGQVEYADGHPNDVHHMAEDVAAFLMWTAEPKMMARKQAGFTAVVFLVVLATLLYLTNKRLWAPYKKAAKGTSTPAE